MHICFIVKNKLTNDIEVGRSSKIKKEINIFHFKTNKLTIDIEDDRSSKIINKPFKGDLESYYLKII